LQGSFGLERGSCKSRACILLIGQGRKGNPYPAHILTRLPQSALSILSSSAYVRKAGRRSDVAWYSEGVVQSRTSCPVDRVIVIGRATPRSLRWATTAMHPRRGTSASFHGHAQSQPSPPHSSPPFTAHHIAPTHSPNHLPCTSTRLPCPYHSTEPFPIRPPTLTTQKSGQYMDHVPRFVCQELIEDTRATNY